MGQRLSRKPSDVLERNGYSVRTVRANLLRVWDSASDEQLLAGLVWYSDAREFAADLARATDTDLVVTAAVIAALSPQTRWGANKAAAVELLKNGTRYPGMLVSNYERAKRVIAAGPMGALAALQSRGDESAPKIAAFARNILGVPGMPGKRSPVTVDVWATRAALLNSRRRDVDPEKLLSRVGMYEAIADQYRWLARRVGVTPEQAQAVVWVTLTNTSAVSVDDSPDW